MLDIIVPFILVFTITYAVLDKTKVLGQENGEPKRRFNAIAAFVIASFTIIAVDVLNLVSRLSQYMVLLLVMGLLLAVLFGFFGFKDLGQKKIGKRVVIPLIFVCFIIVLLYVFGWLDILDWSAIYRYSGVLIGLAVFFIVIWLILREPKKEATPAASAPAPTPKKEKKSKKEFKLLTRDELQGMSPEEQQEYIKKIQQLSEEELQEMAAKQGLRLA